MPLDLFMQDEEYTCQNIKNFHFKSTTVVKELLIFLIYQDKVYNSYFMVKK